MAEEPRSPADHLLTDPRLPKELAGLPVAAGSEAALTVALEDQIPLAELDFTDLYFSENGEAFMRGVADQNGPLSFVPSTVVKDLDTLHQIVCDRGQRTNEFHVDFDGIRYRVSKIASISVTWYALRRAKSPIPRFGSLGIHPMIVQHLGKLGKKHGLIIFSGRTGEGKTTTASSLLQEYLTVYGDVGITIEDPPELPLEGQHGKFGRCFQVQVENGDFATAMTSTLRYNPRYILLGEVRSAKEASLALRAAINGHVVLTTIHAGSVMETVNGMLKLVAAQESLDLARTVLADGLAGVIHQKMIRGRGQQKTTLQLDFLFPGDDPGIRARIREGKVEQLSSDIEMQKSRVMNGQSPIAKG